MGMPVFGLKVMAGTAIENVALERLAADPASFTHVRIWENTTDNKVRYSQPDGVGGWVVKEFTDQANVDQQISSVTTMINNLGAAFEYKGTIAPGADAGTALDLTTIAWADREAGDYYKVANDGYIKTDALATPVFVKAKDGVVFNSTQTETVAAFDHIDNTNSEVAGTTDEIVVTGSSDVGFTVSLAQAIKDRFTSIENSIGDLATLTTTDKTNLVAAINEINAKAGDGAAALKTAINAQTKRYHSDSVITTADPTVLGGGGKATSHTITHGFGSEFATFEYYVLMDGAGESGQWERAMGSEVLAADKNSVTVGLGVTARHLKAVAVNATPLA